MKRLRRFWFEFEIPDDEAGQQYEEFRLGCGVTAYSYGDALRILSEGPFRTRPLPNVRKVLEDVDVSTLDPGHVLPNMGVPTWRGVWFPRGYE